MFTGIVEEAGKVLALEPTPTGHRLTVETTLVHLDASLGASIANNGCCLTVVSIDGNRLSFDLLEETLRKTNLHKLAPGRLVNLERSLSANARLGGHFVSGHIDTTGTITKWEPQGSDYVLEVELPRQYEKYLVPKGSIAVDGISLTVGPVEGNRFTVWIIPHTRAITALCDRSVGDPVNLECDLLAKYAEKILLSTSHNPSIDG